MTDNPRKTKFLGFELASPIIAASGPPTRDYKKIKNLASAGVGGIVTKTILEEPSTNPTPCLSSGDNYFLNTERCSTISRGRWVEKELPKAKKLPIPIIASIGMTPDDAGKLAGPIVEAGADMVELSIFTRYDDPSPMVAAVKNVKSEVDVPVLVKLSPNVNDLVAFALSIEQAGADGVSAIDAVKAGIQLDTASGKPLLRKQGFGRVSGEAIKPIALYHVALLAHYTDLTIVGTGGISAASDIVDMISVGAEATGICTALIEQGPGFASELNSQLDEFCRDHQVDSLTDIKGRTLTEIKFPETREARLEYEKSEVEEGRLTAVIDETTCIDCGKCKRVCPYEAVVETDGYQINRDRCVGCGLCVSICPVGAIEYNET